MGKIGKHRSEISSLQEKDPEFYQFLQQHDQQSLQFGVEEDEEEDEEDIDEDIDEDLENENEDEDENIQETMDEYDDGEEEEEEVQIESTEVTAELLVDAIAKANVGSYSGLKRLLAYFRAACIPFNSRDPNRDSASGSGRYTVSSAQVYNDVMIDSLTVIHTSFKKMLLEDSSTASKKNKEFDFKTLSKHKSWKKYESLILSFFKSYSATLSSIRINPDAAGELAVYLLTSLKEYMFLLHGVPRIARSILKVLLGIWAEGPDTATDQWNIRGHAFLRIQQLAKTLSGSMTEECFRSMYLTFARVCKSYSETIAPSISFMMESIVQLFLLDEAQAYQHGFLYIRQLSLHVRAALLKKTTDNSKRLASWQYVNCVRLWTKVLCAMPSQEQLGRLIFPLVQVITGLFTAVQSNYFLPLRFHMTSCLQQLSAHGRVLIPNASRLCEQLEIPELTAKPTPSTETAPPLPFIIKFPTSSISTQVVKDLIVQETVALLQQESDLYKYNAGYPEYMFQVTKKLRSFAKATKVSKWRDLCKALVSQLEDQSTWVKQARAKIPGFLSSGIASDFESLLPVGSASAGARISHRNRMKGASNQAELQKQLSTDGQSVRVPSAAGMEKAFKQQQKQQKQQSKRKRKDNDDDEDDEDDEDEDDEDDEEDEEEDYNLAKTRDDEDDEDDDSDDEWGADDDMVEEEIEQEEEEEEEEEEEGIDGTSFGFEQGALEAAIARATGRFSKVEDFEEADLDVQEDEQEDNTKVNKKRDKSKSKVIANKGKVSKELKGEKPEKKQKKHKSTLESEEDEVTDFVWDD